MTKRALIIISVLILLPILVTLIAAVSFEMNNKVVANYGESIDIIEYDGLTLRRVEGDENYTFRFGEYLGKVGSSFRGAPLYRVADDEGGHYYAIAEGERRILYTESGELIPFGGEEARAVTRIVFDNYLVEETDEEKLALIAASSGKKVKVDMSSFKSYKYYDLRISLNGSPIVTEYFGRLIKLSERDEWIFINPAELDAAQEEYGDELSETVYIAELIENEDLLSLLDSYFITK